MKETDSSPKPIINHEPLEDASHADEALDDKLVDAMTPGFEAEFDPDEAERAGAFTEDALSEVDALDSIIDLADEG